MQAVKNQPLLARAFVRMLSEHPAAKRQARLVMLGDGPLMGEVRSVLAQAELVDHAWLPGARDDVARLMPLFDCFALPSHAEGTSCTLQEAMACGLPAVATAVGGTPDLVAPGPTGWLVPPADEASLAEALWLAFSDRERSAAYGAAARAEAEKRFSLSTMLRHYSSLFGFADAKAAASEPTTGVQA
jgi:glycosyltransferase involved in cell wall biosynthesis